MNLNPGPLPESIRFLAIEGVIGVGKTSLCRLLTDRFNARLVLEEAEENPFLPRFYQDRSAWAFQTQLWFLVSRYKQLTEAFIQQDLFTSATISDYMFSKDRIFASINLDDDELALYNTVCKSLERDVARPDFVVYLQATPEILEKRIEKRARPFEFNMDRRYLEILCEAYNQFFFHYDATPLLIINTSEIDFVHNPEDLDELACQIASAKSGINHYTPLGAGNRKKLFPGLWR